MRDCEGDYIYEVWRRGGNPDTVNSDEIPENYDWVYDKPMPKHLPRRQGGEDEQWPI
jgi:hypothetical protein